jgi:hypothetical protein
MYSLIILLKLYLVVYVNYLMIHVLSFYNNNVLCGSMIIVPHSRRKQETHANIMTLRNNFMMFFQQLVVCT